MLIPMPTQVTTSRDEAFQRAEAPDLRHQRADPDRWLGFGDDPTAQPSGTSSRMLCSTRRATSMSPVTPFRPSRTLTPRRGVM